MASAPSSSAGSLPPANLSLSVIVSHFVAAKTSLQSTTHVFRANDIVATARASLESFFTLAANNAFLARSIHTQLHVLKSIAHGLDLVARDVDVDFKAHLQRLDATDASIKQILHVLRTTTVERAFRPPDEQQKTLHDFVDEQGVDELTSVFHECIDHITEAQRNYASSNAQLDADIQSLEETLQPLDADPDPNTDESPAALFRSLEAHATEMADLLQSLVRHYDLCTTALKHTEGGGEAVQHAHVDLPAGVESAEGPEPVSGPAEPISDDERAEMLAVLDNDAAQVDGVVHELRERASDMEAQLTRLLALEQDNRQRNAAASASIAALAALGTVLPDHIASSTIFASRWRDIKARLLEKLAELDGLGAFFAGFQRAYDGLLLEVARRRDVRTRMHALAHDALARIDRLHAREAEQRDAYRQENGEFLPSDLWPGLLDAPTRFEIRPVDDGSVDIPEIAPETLEQAAKRITGRG